MTAKRFTLSQIQLNRPYSINDNKKKECMTQKEVEELLNALHEENQELKEDVEYWKQVASQYSNELNVFESCKKYKTECKDIYWSSD